MMAFAKAKAIVTLVAVPIVLCAGASAFIAQMASTSVPNPAAAQPIRVEAPVVAVPVDPAQAADDAVKAFLAALQTRDGQRVADLVAGDVPQSRRATADKYLAEIREGAYAPFPERLAEIVGRMSTSDPDGRITHARYEVASPIDADARTLSLTLEPVGGKWLVTDATLTAANSIREAARSNAVAAKVDGSARAYVEAFGVLEELSAFSRRVMAVEAETDAQARGELVDQIWTYMTRFAASLEGTDLEFPGVMKRAEAAWPEYRRFVQEHGLKAAAAEEDRPDSSFSAALAPMHRMWASQEELAARIDAAEMASTPARPISFGVPIDLTLGWNGQKLTIPGPATVPPWFRETKAYQLWRMRGNFQTLSCTDGAGNIYAIAFMGRSRESDGELRDMISTVKVYRPDGTLAAASNYAGGDTVSGWAIMDGSGKQYLWKVTNVRDEKRIQQFDGDGNQIIWTADARDQVTQQTSCDPIGEHAETVKAGSNGISAMSR